MKTLSWVWALVLVGCAGASSSRPTPEQLADHARVEQRTRYFEQLRAEGNEIVCVLESDVQASTYARMRHAYVEALRDLEAGRRTAADAHLREVHEIHRWTFIPVEDPDALLERSSRLLDVSEAYGR